MQRIELVVIDVDCVVVGPKCRVSRYNRLPPPSVNDTPGRNARVFCTVSREKYRWSTVFPDRDNKQGTFCCLPSSPALLQTPIRNKTVFSDSGQHGVFLFFISTPPPPSPPSHFASPTDSKVQCDAMRLGMFWLCHHAALTPWQRG